MYVYVYVVELSPAPRCGEPRSSHTGSDGTACLVPTAIRSAAFDPDPPKVSREYRVRIEYQEPTYRSPSGPRRDPYSWVFRVWATGKASARARAVEVFKDWAKDSGVSWVREIVSVTVLADG